MQKFINYESKYSISLGPAERQCDLEFQLANLFSEKSHIAHNSATTEPEKK